MCLTAGGQARPAPLQSGAAPCTQQLWKGLPLQVIFCIPRHPVEPVRGRNNSDKSGFCSKSPQRVFLSPRRCWISDPIPRGCLERKDILSHAGPVWVSLPQPSQQDMGTAREGPSGF